MIFLDPSGLERAGSTYSGHRHAVFREIEDFAQVELLDRVDDEMHQMIRRRPITQVRRKQ